MTATAIPDRCAAARGRPRHGVPARTPWSNWLAPALGGVGMRSAALELVASMMLAMAIAYLLRPGDPLLLELGFPWAWVLPLVLALRYGTLAGAGAALLMAAGWFLFHGIGAQAGEFPETFFLGGLLLVLIGGQFGDIWAGRLARERATNRYLDERLAALTKKHYLLRISHARLESDLLARPATLRDALAQLRMATLEAGEAAPAGVGRGVAALGLPGAHAMMQLAAQVCQLEAAAVHRCDGGRIAPRPVASIGVSCELDLDDPLLRRCLDTAQLAHQRGDGVPDPTVSRYLAVVPLLAGGARMIGVLLVERMPFLALHHDNLELLLVLMGYYADGVEHGPAAHAVRQLLPACPHDFALEYARLARLRREAGVPSTIVALVFGGDERSGAWFDQIVRGGRAAEQSWALPVAAGGPRALLTLVPLAGAEAADGYLAGVEQMLQAQYGVGFAQSRVAVHTLAVPADADPEALLRLVQRCQSQSQSQGRSVRHG